MHFIGKENYMYKHHEREGEKLHRAVKLMTKIEGEGKGGGKRQDVTFILLYLI